MPGLYGKLIQLKIQTRLKCNSTYLIVLEISERKVIVKLCVKVIFESEK